MSKHRLTYLKHVHWLFKNKAVVREADVILVSVALVYCKVWGIFIL